MSIKIMSQVWDSEKFDGRTLLLLLALADSANDEGVCWPSLQTLMKKTRLPERTVYQAIKTLIDDGWLEKKSTRGSQKVFYKVTPKGPQPLQTSPERSATIAKKSACIAEPPHPHKGRTVIEPSQHDRDAVERVFNYYRGTIGKSNTYTLTDLRMKKGLARFAECLVKTEGKRDFAEELMKICVDALEANEFFMGKNDRKRPFNDWEDQLFGSESRMEKWLEEAQRG
jgi:hypothetical protein